VSSSAGRGVLSGLSFPPDEHFTVREIIFQKRVGGQKPPRKAYVPKLGQRDVARGVRLPHFRL
jgi:hypothetical protein